MANYNIQRIERDIEKYLPMIIQRECKDEILKSITITDCELTHDLSFCKVFFTSLMDMDQKELEKEVNEASPFIRTKLASMMEIRNTPILKFTYDTSIDYAKRIESALEKIKDNK